MVFIIFIYYFSWCQITVILFSNSEGTVQLGLKYIDDQNKDLHNIVTGLDSTLVVKLFI